MNFLANVWNWRSFRHTIQTRESTDIAQINLSVWDCCAVSSVKSNTIDYSHGKIHIPVVENSQRHVDCLRFICFGYSHEFLLISSFFIWMVHQTELTILSLDFGSTGSLEENYREVWKGVLSMLTLRWSVLRVKLYLIYHLAALEIYCWSRTLQPYLVYLENCKRIVLNKIFLKLSNTIYTIKQTQP